ncbi:hypothetical protein DXT24_01640 [Enterococcus faecalis]|nr:hypothetical protein [Enterococcus faecalis]PQE41178.1 hypothetical protein CUS13_13085 [Enterococcus faecalis]RXW10666.1 hypothetical protein CYQ13_02200 [Enterococcus faecalis]
MHSPNCPFVWQLFLFNNKTIIYRAFLPLKVKLRFVILCLVKIQGTLFYKCQDLAATRIATLVRIAGALFYEWDNVLFPHLVLLITLKGQTAASMRSLHLLCHFVPIVVIRSKKTTTYPKCLGVVVVFMQNKNHIDGSSMWSFFLLEYNQHRYTF